MNKSHHVVSQAHESTQNQELFSSEESQIQTLLHDHPELQEIEEALDRFGAAQYDQRSISERNHARLRVLKHVHQFYLELESALDELAQAHDRIEHLQNTLNNVQPLLQNSLDLSKLTQESD